MNLKSDSSIRAVFFDRDGTLTYTNPEKIIRRNELISGLSGKPFVLDYERSMHLFSLAGYHLVKTLEDEREFYRRYYRCLLVDEGVTENVDYYADILLKELWCNNDRILYPEVKNVLDYFRSKGFLMGVISDTSPSLQLSLEQLGLGSYFHSYTASSLVGAQKPSPIIYQSALKSLNVTAGESLYIDDCYEEAAGAREMGFTSFYLDRKGEIWGDWIVHDLEEYADYMRNKGKD